MPFSIISSVHFQSFYCRGANIAQCAHGQDPEKSNQTFPGHFSQEHSLFLRLGQFAAVPQGAMTTHHRHPNHTIPSGYNWECPAEHPNSFCHTFSLHFPFFSVISHFLTSHREDNTAFFMSTTESLWWQARVNKPKQKLRVTGNDAQRYGKLSSTKRMRGKAQRISLGEAKQLTEGRG